MIDDVTIYCDGSCLGNPGPGGWAALLVVGAAEGRQEKMLTGSERHTTNNRMEISGALFGLRALKRPCAVLVVTDSNYVVKGMSEWRHGWIKRGWKKADGKPVENRDLWEELVAAAGKHTVKWQWVKGHAGHLENERVDAAANGAALAASSMASSSGGRR
ncbi:MAG TPA: ribonuclease HI [Myxococcota bacterium]|jgi:ribonuclease HI